MRQLRVEKPPIRGTDVMDWQTFLINQGLLTDVADGIFGPSTAKASRDYQTNVGIGADGVVGPFTLARALDGGLTSTAEPLQAGMDANVNCTELASNIAVARIKFVVRYYSKFSSKALTLTEARALSGAGLQLMTVYQDTNDKLEFFTTDIGAEQARRALDLAGGIGQPEGSAIYFAADFDPAPDDVRGPLMEYFHAVHDVFATSPYSVGVYGSGLACRLIRDSGFAKFTWLSQSTGFRDYRAFLPQADVVQAAPARDLIPQKLNIDDDIAQSADFGAFQLSTAT
jgi:peptidoglycan hydrolase-like protein with peptidoglycan-binding domain